MRTTTASLALALVIIAPHLPAQTTRASFPAEEAIPVSVRWNRIVPTLVTEASAARRATRAAATAAGDSATLRRLAQTPPPMLFRVYTLLSFAQYVAANSAGNDRVSSHAAIASASATVLSDIFTDSAVRASIARELARDIDRASAAARRSNRAGAGARLGADVARRLLADAPTLNFAAQWSGTIPEGPGMWYSAPRRPPEGIFFATTRPWLLDTVAQFRPEPPPVFDSPAFRSALDEVRRVVRDLTPEQRKLAQKWSAADPWAVWNEIASNALRRNRVPERQTARVLAVLNAAASDAVVACFEAKYHYWTIRPSQADTTLVIPDSVGLPNFPAYPSGHACSAGAFAEVLTHYLPRDSAEFKRVAEEQAMARLYGGVHYRFDNDVGLALGRRVAQHAVQAERRGRLTVGRTGQPNAKH